MILEIEKLIHGGYGLARYSGGVCLVPFTVPGDVLDVCFLNENKKSFGWINKIIHPSPYRKEVICPVFTRCGGCDYEHMDYHYELKIKNDILKEDMIRIAGFSAIKEPEIISASCYGYRNHAQFKVDGMGNVGFFAKQSHEVVALPPEGCLLLNKEINRYVMSIMDKARKKQGGFRVRAGAGEVIYKKGISGLSDDSYCFYQAGGITFRIGIDDFFQINSLLMDPWAQTVISLLEPEKEDKVLDLFSGSGIIGILLASSVEHVTCVEINGSAVKNAKFNAFSNSVENISFIRTNLYKNFKSSWKANKVVVDPPRSGLGKVLLEGLCAISPFIIVYASCDTSTFSRDLRVFLQNGYHPENIILLDMFPRTKHTEVVSKLVRVYHN